MDKLIAIAEDESIGTLRLCSVGSHYNDYDERIVDVRYHVSFYESLWHESNIENEEHTYWMMKPAYDTFKGLLKRHGFKNVSLCPNFEELYEEYLDPDYDDHYTTSSTAGDYGPNNPWDAPGMSVHDFI